MNKIKISVLSGIKEFLTFSAMLETTFDNYIIRPLQQCDASGYFNLIDSNRHRLEDFFAGTVSKTKTLEDTESFVAANVIRREEKKYYPFVLIDTTDKKVIGFIDVKSIDWRIPKAEFGCFINEKYTGKGISKTAMNIVIDHLFNDLGFNKLFLRTHEKNKAARALAESCGFEVEGHLRRDHKTTSGEVIDLLYYGLLKRGA